jgi:hypothetical protein
MAEKVTVKSGQTLSSIAKANNTTVAAIQAANPVLASNPKYQGGNVIFSGTKLTIPTVSTTQTTSPYNTTGPFNPQGGVGTGSYGPSSTPSTTTSQFPAAGTVISSSSIDNGDGTFTITTIYADGKGGTYQTVTQSGKKKEEEDKTKTTNLSEEAFINTLKLLMGSAEASKPYVKQLYTLVSKYYKSGSTVSDAINLALYDAEENKLVPEFTTRFSGIFKLRDRRAAGEAIDVPTIAEYIKSQERLGDILRQSALGALANETFLNTVMATGKSVDESTSIIVDVFDLIDNAPEVVKAQFAKNYPSVSRAQLATALLTGTEGVKQLEKTVKKSGVIAAGTTQGIEVSDTLASDLVSKGQNFQTAGVGFSKVAQILPEARRLTSIDAGLAAGQQEYTTEQAVAATFDQSAKELQILADAAEREGARFSKRTGIAGSRSLASQARGYGSGLI